MPNSPRDLHNTKTYTQITKVTCTKLEHEQTLNIMYVRDAIYLFDNFCPDWCRFSLYMVLL